MVTSLTRVSNNVGSGVLNLMVITSLSRFIGEVQVYHL